MAGLQILRQCPKQTGNSNTPFIYLPLLLETMKQRDCPECGDILSVSEDETENETPVEHFNRTGHLACDIPVPVGCEQCGNIWFYSGSQSNPTCSYCRGWTKVGETIPLGAVPFDGLPESMGGEEE